MAEIMKKKITIDPVTRLEGHGKIDIFLDEKGDVECAYFIVPELRGFEVFSIGRPAEDMPQITSRICGICPMAHHIASTKALDDLYRVDPPAPAKKIRELLYNTFVLEDHALHVYILGGPDFIVGPLALPSKRNILGEIPRIGKEVALKIISMRRRLREFITCVAGKAIHPVFGLPGGVAKGLASEDLSKFKELSKDSLDFALFTLQVFKDMILKNKEYMKLITSDIYAHKTYYMGLVDGNNSVNFYHGQLRVVDPEGNEFTRFTAPRYEDYIAEHVEPWSYMKFCYLKQVGWKGFKEGPESGIYSVAPLARLNAADGMATPQAQKAYEEFYHAFGGKPVHYTLANHWARIIEMIYAAERMGELLHDPDITSRNLRTIPGKPSGKGIGVVEAPRGTLIHHYETDEQGIIQKTNLIVGTQNNSGRISMSVEKAARGLIRNGQVSEGLLNEVEIAFRAYDPCNSCATHCLPGSVQLEVVIYDHKGKVAKVITRGGDA